MLWFVSNVFVYKQVLKLLIFILPEKKQTTSLFER